MIADMDMLAKKYLKSWLNIPARGATDIGIFHPYMLNVKSPSQIYLEGHAGNFTLTRMKGDPTVNACLDSQLERESQWSRKSSTIVRCDQVKMKYSFLIQQTLLV